MGSGHGKKDLDGREVGRGEVGVCWSIRGIQKVELSDRDEVRDPTLGKTPNGRSKRKAAVNILY